MAVEHFVATSQRVPPWALVNRLAHGSIEQLQAIGGREPRAVVERSLALRLLVGAGSPAGVRVAQQQVLVPVELSLIEQAKQGPVTVGVVAEAVTTALDHHLLGR
jgi:hypothetical protein